MKSHSEKYPNPEKYLTEAERVIYYSAMEKSGIFAVTCHLIWRGEKGIILSDGTCVYPLGEIGSVRDLIGSHSCALGGKENVLKVLGGEKRKKWKLMDKVFSKYTFSDHPRMTDPPYGIKIEIVCGDEQIEDFCRMKGEFIEEESGSIVNSKEIRDALRESGGNTLPVIMSLNGDAAGMVSSSFHTKHGNMINMLFIKKKYRSRGYGRVLLDWYIGFLSRSAGKNYLFYSPENELARKLYEKKGFVEIDRWLMAVR